MTKINIYYQFNQKFSISSIVVCMLLWEFKLIEIIVFLKSVSKKALLSCKTHYHLKMILLYFKEFVVFMPKYCLCPLLRTIKKNLIIYLLISVQYKYRQQWNVQFMLFGTVGKCPTPLITLKSLSRIRRNFIEHD